MGNKPDLGKLFYLLPYAVIALDFQFVIVEMNDAAKQIFCQEQGQAFTGQDLAAQLQTDALSMLVLHEKCVAEQILYLEKYDKYVELIAMPDLENSMYFLVLKDITKEYRQRESYQQRRSRTIDLTDQVIQKQMRIVQEIASLLGETTAETKIALTQVKNMVQDGEAI